MANTLAPEVRSQFAKRLKTIRTQRGFPRARYFAKTLGIEENRYTRYERAEVEPNLTLIHKMCQTLGVSPNELLGFGEPRPGRHEAIPGVAEESREDEGFSPEPEAAGIQPDPLGSLAWSLAAEIVTIRQRHAGRGKAGDTFAALQETSALFAALRAEPFRTVAEIVNDRALKDVDGANKARLAELAQAFTDAAREPGRARRRR